VHAPASTTSLGAGDNDVIAVIENLGGLESIRLPRIEPERKAPPDRVVPAENLLADRDSGRRVPLDIGSECRSAAA
jgi:hypothetical protein